jgi:transglutaminase-like putative cysteine protease
VFSYDDAGGTVHHFSLRQPHTTLDIVATAEVETLLTDPFHDLNLLDSDWAFYQTEGTHQNFVEFLSDSPYVPLLPEAFRISEEIRRPNTSVARFLIDLCSHIHSLLAYDTDATHVYTTLREVLCLRAGVCQDFAHLAIACARAQGIPSRYVSGYLYAGPGSAMRGEQATHAWMECLLPDGRWLALDPTNNLLAGDHHIRVHIGRDYSEVSPTRGIYVGAAASKLEVSVAVSDVGISSDAALAAGKSAF